jgi:regulator of protease activity HflC (stomatin/prohibitin superfamily)
MYVRLESHEYAVVVRNNNYVRLLTPGTHWGLSLAGPHVKIETVSALAGLLSHRLSWQVLNDPKNKALFDKVEVADGQFGLYWLDGHFAGFLRPGSYGVFKGPRVVKTLVLEAEPGKIVEGLDLRTALTHPLASQYFDVVNVGVGQVAQLTLAGKTLGLFESGQYVFFKQAQSITARYLSLREILVDITGQEIMTQDKVTLRLNLALTYKVSDPATAFETDGSSNDHVFLNIPVYRLAQLALRASVGGRTLDSLLADKESLGTELAQALNAPARDLGVAIKSVGVRDIILPGEMKDLFNKVLQAQKEAEANVIKRREETAAARSQANTAKLLSESPMLLKLREMELLGEVLSGANVTLVVGEGELTRKVLSLTTEGKR